MNEQDLLKLKRRVEDAKNSIAELKGQRTVLMKQLKDDWGCGTVEEAEKKIQSMNQEIHDLDEEIDKGIKELQKKFDV